MDAMRCPSCLFAKAKYELVVFNTDTNNEATPNTTGVNDQPSKICAEPTDRKPVTAPITMMGSSNPVFRPPYIFSACE